MIALCGGVLSASKIRGLAARMSNHLIHLPSWSFISKAGLFVLAAGAIFEPRPASAVPSYARQTGQTCATCHTAFPELTPFGRQFKLMGYTAGGTRCNDGSAKSDETQVPLALMAWPATFTHYNNKAANPTTPPNSINDNDWLPGQFSLFVAGQLYCDVGSFAQQTYDRPGNSFTWDNTDIRYAKTGVIDGTNIVYGITANNSPGVQDVWNSTPVFGFPYIVSEVAPTPAVGTALATTKWLGNVGGVGGYVWIDNSIYVEFTAYGALPPRLLTDLNGGAVGVDRFANAAPYWRVAYERTWDENSLMFGTFGMYTDTQPANTSVPFTALLSPRTDPTIDVGVDSQYQWIGECHIFTVRASYIWENRRNDSELPLGLASNLNDQVNDLNINASYIWDRKISFTAGYFSTWGTTDPLLYGTLATGGPSPNGSPNSSGWNFELAYLPFMDGAPGPWPWFNARIGVLYTHYDVFNGTSGESINPANGALVKASGNDTVFFYTWLMF
jgi:hypothetical protein